jgi:hypothetical protein
VQFCRMNYSVRLLAKSRGEQPEGSRDILNKPFENPKLLDRSPLESETQLR